MASFIFSSDCLLSQAWMAAARSRQFRRRFSVDSRSSHGAPHFPGHVKRNYVIYVITCPELIYGEIVIFISSNRSCALRSGAIRQAVILNDNKKNPETIQDGRPTACSRQFRRRFSVDSRSSHGAPHFPGSRI